MTSPEPELIPWSAYDAYREVIAHPGRFEEERFSLTDLRTAATKAEVLFRGWPFILVDSTRGRTKTKNDRIETELSLTHLTGYVSFERWELHQSGLFAHKVLMDEATMPVALARGKVLDFIETVYHVSEAIGSLWRLYVALGVPEDELVMIAVRYGGMLGRVVDVLDPRRASIFDTPPCAEPLIERHRELPLVEWRSADAQIAAEMSVEIFERAGWIKPNRPEIEKITREFIAAPRF